MKLNVRMQINDSLNVKMNENNESFLHGSSEMQAVTILDSPEFTGTPTAPTPPVGNNTNRLATTEFVTKAIELAHTGYGNIVLLSVAEVTS